MPGLLKVNFHPKASLVIPAQEITGLGIYHLTLAQEAFHHGHTVYLINGYRLNRYRNSVGVSAKTDQNDARLLRRYLERLAKSDSVRVNSVCYS